MKKCELNNRTPKWFRDWHRDFFIHTEKRTKRNERLIYIILVAILGSAVLDGGLEGIARLVQNLIG